MDVGNSQRLRYETDAVAEGGGIECKPIAVPLQFRNEFGRIQQGHPPENRCVAREKQLSPFSQFHQGGGGKITGRAPPPDPNVPLKAGRPPPPVTPRATEPRTRVLSQQPKRFLKKARQYLVVSGAKINVVATSQFQPAI